MLRLQCRVSCIPYHFRGNARKIEEVGEEGGRKERGNEPKGANSADVLQDCIIDNGLDGDLLNGLMCMLDCRLSRMTYGVWSCGVCHFHHFFRDYIIMTGHATMVAHI